MIEQIVDIGQKRAISRKILESLHDWFELDESREKYIADSSEWVFFAAKELEN